MRAFIVQISTLAGLVLFLSQMWAGAATEQALFVSLGLGIAVYFTLVVGENLVLRILTATPSPDDPQAAKITSEESNEADGPQDKPASTPLQTT